MSRFMFESSKIEADEREKKTQTHIAVTRKIIPAYPGETITLPLNVYGPKGHVVEITVEGLSGVASVSAAPNRAEAPYTASIVIKVSPGVQPGLYPFTVKVWDDTDGLLLGVEKAALLVLKRELPKRLAGLYHDAENMFREYGSTGLVWYILKYVYPEGAVFRR